VIATTAAISETIRLEENGIAFYALPDQPPILYNENKESNIRAWQKLIDDEKPDLIQVWGTEFTHGLCALRLAKGIPSVIYMQGYLGSIARHYLAGMTHDELKKSVTFRDIIKRDSIVQQQKKYDISTAKEKEMFELSGNVICENDWCENSIRAVVPDINIYRCPLSINQVFTQYSWDNDNAELHSIVCNASGYPLKGLHMLLRAVGLLKKEYPDIKLYVPGEKVTSDGSLKWLIRKRGYTKYIERLIRELDIENNIIWLGSLPQDKLAEQYAKARVFVLCSAIENHSSSLKEAMMVGIPSVASAVGGVPEYVTHGKNGLLYRFEEYDILASHISRLFEDDELAQKISANAKASSTALHSEKDIYDTTIKIYNSVLGQ
jgi:glycosyltransferase involved in cell wall biosynthesis